MRLSTALLLPAVLALLAGCSRPEAAPVPDAVEAPEPAAPAGLLAAGEEVYNQTCAQCHLDGSGSEINPPLIGSAVVSDPDPARLLRVILHGQTGNVTVAGRTYNAIMPAQGSLPDADIAAVATWVRSNFGGRPGAVDTNRVAAERARPR